MSTRRARTLQFDASSSSASPAAAPTTPPQPQAPTVPSPPAVDVTSLRRLIHSYVDQRMHASAIFYGDKLVSITNDVADIHTLAELYALDRQFKRAVLLLRQRGLLDMDDLRYRYTAATCLAECEEWVECLLVLGQDDDALMDALGAQVNTAAASSLVITNLASAVCMVRARVYEALENHAKRVFWLQEALRRDGKCVEAFDALVEKRTLNYEDEMALLEQVRVPPGMEWLKLMYAAKIDQFHYRTALVPTHVDALQTTYGMADNLDLQTSLAHYHYQRNRYDDCYAVTKRIISTDPYHHSALPVHLCAMVELGLKSELYYCAHQLVEPYAGRAIAWFGVGCYYYLIGNYDIARRYFQKSTGLDHHFAPAWIGVAHSYAALDEPDQAMSAYRTAARLFAGSHVPLLCIGMEYMRSSHNQTLATQFLTNAHAICPIDPMVYNEIGVVNYSAGEYATAVHYFKTSLDQVPVTPSAMTEAVLINLGHAYRKMGEYEHAVTALERALEVTSTNPAIYTALGFTFHLMGGMSRAIDYYHKALGMRPRDTFTTDMLTRAFNEIMLSETNWFDDAGSAAAGGGGGGDGGGMMFEEFKNEEY